MKITTENSPILEISPIIFTEYFRNINEYNKNGIILNELIVIRNCKSISLK